MVLYIVFGDMPGYFRIFSNKSLVSLQHLLFL